MSRLVYSQSWGIQARSNWRLKNIMSKLCWQIAPWSLSSWTKLIPMDTKKLSILHLHMSSLGIGKNLRLFIIWDEHKWSFSKPTSKLVQELLVHLEWIWLATKGTKPPLLVKNVKGKLWISKSMSKTFSK